MVPRPFSELWVDNYAIVKDAPNLDQAYDFLAYQLQPDVQLAETQYNRLSGGTGPVSQSKLPPILRTPISSSAARGSTSRS